MLSGQKTEDCDILIREKKNYNGIDLIKFLCAILVFLIHIPLFSGEVSGFAKYVSFGLKQYVCRIAVPFYFVTSGYFLFRKMPLYNLDKDTIKSYWFTILRLLGTWYVLLLVGGTGHLWYMGATVVAIILLSLCLHFRIRLRYIYAIAGVLYAIGLLGDSYYGIIAPLENNAIVRWIFSGYRFIFQTTRNGVFMGFIFVLMGATFAHYGIHLKTKTALTGFAASMLCLFAEVFILKYKGIPAEYNMYVFLVPATFFLFSFAVTLTLKDRAIYKHLRHIGMVVYFSHLLINNVTVVAVDVIDKYCGTGLVRFRFVFVLSFTLLFAVFTEWLSCKDRFKWLSWLTS